MSLAVWAAEPPRTLHLTLNATIDESGSEPTVTTVMLMVTRDAKPDVVGSALVRQGRATDRGGVEDCLEGDPKCVRSARPFQ
jgi:hypothetical protein